VRYVLSSHGAGGNLAEESIVIDICRVNLSRHVPITTANPVDYLYQKQYLDVRCQVFMQRTRRQCCLTVT